MLSVTSINGFEGKNWRTGSCRGVERLPRARQMLSQGYVTKPSFSVAGRHPHVTAATATRRRRAACLDGPNYRMCFRRSAVRSANATSVNVGFAYPDVGNRELPA